MGSSSSVMSAVSVVAGPVRPAWGVGGLFEEVVAPTCATSVAEPATRFRRSVDQAGELLEGLLGAAGDGVGALAAEGVIDDE